MALTIEAKKRPKGDGFVALRYALSRKTRKYFSTGVVIPVADFKKGNLLKPVRSSNPNCAHFNRMAEEVYNRITEIEAKLRRDNIDPTAELVFEIFHRVESPAMKSKEDHSLKALFESFLAAENYSFNTEKLYKTLLTHLNNFFGDLSLDNFRLEEWNAFRRYLGKDKHLNSNTIRIRLNKLKHFINWVKKQGVSVPLQSFPMPKEEIKKVMLDKKGLRMIKEYQPLTFAMSQVKDLCLTQCFTGLRISDLFRLRPEHIKCDDDRYWIEMRSTKTDRNMVIPLANEAVDILRKHNFQLPIIAEQYYNRELKKLARLAGVDNEIEWLAYDEKNKKYHKTKKLYQVFSSHACARTAIAYFDDQGYKLSQITQIVGKSMGTLLKYYYGRTTTDDILETQRDLAQSTLVAAAPTFDQNLTLTMHKN